MPLLLCPRAVCRSPARIDGKPPLDGKKAGKGGEEVEEQRPPKGALLSMLRLPALRAAAISRQTRHPSLGISAMAILSRLGRLCQPGRGGGTGHDDAASRHRPAFALSGAHVREGSAGGLRACCYLSPPSADPFHHRITIAAVVSDGRRSNSIPARLPIRKDCREWRFLFLRVFPFIYLFFPP